MQTPVPAKEQPGALLATHVGRRFVGLKARRSVRGRRVLRPAHRAALSAPVGRSAPRGGQGPHPWGGKRRGNPYARTDRQNVPGRSCWAYTAGSRGTVPDGPRAQERDAASPLAAPPQKGRRSPPSPQRRPFAFRGRPCRGGRPHSREPDVRVAFRSGVAWAAGAVFASRARLATHAPRRRRARRNPVVGMSPRCL